MYQIISTAPAAVKYPYTPLRIIPHTTLTGTRFILVSATPQQPGPARLASAPILVNGSHLLDLQAVPA